MTKLRFAFLTNERLRTQATGFLALLTVCSLSFLAACAMCPRSSDRCPHLPIQFEPVP